MTAAAFKATYADWRLIKTRSVVQVVFEVPLEQADAAYQVLNGMPNFGSEQWFAIAKLHPEAKEQEPARVVEPPARARNRKDWHELSAAAQAAIRCNEPRFQAFLCERFDGAWRLMNAGSDAERAAEVVRFKCEVKSRKDILPGTEALDRWHYLDESYRAWLMVAV